VTGRMPRIQNIILIWTVWRAIASTQAIDMFVFLEKQ
jgi:hypothetical protein